MSSKKHRNRIWIKNLKDGKVPEFEWLNFDFSCIPIDANLVYIDPKKSLGKQRSETCVTYIIQELEKLGFSRNEWLSKQGWVIQGRRIGLVTGALHRGCNTVEIDLLNMEYFAPSSFKVQWDQSPVSVSLSALQKANNKTRSYAKRIGLV